MISGSQSLIILPCVDSTNNYAMAQIRAGTAISGECWLALEQTAGKGQRQKAWNSPPGKNITLSMALQPNLPLNNQFLLSAASALAVWDFYQEKAGDETRIKWPNDIYWRDRKAGGILIENSIQNKLDGGATSWEWAVIGIGLNINQEQFNMLSPRPVSLKQITGKDWDIIELARELCINLHQRFQQMTQPAMVLHQYNKVLYKRGEQVKLKKSTRVFEAHIAGVNNCGELMVKTSVEERFGFGDVQWVI